MNKCLPLFFAALILLACGKNQEILHPLPQMDEDVLSESFGVRYIYSDSARPQVLLKGGRVIEKKDPGTNHSILYFYDGVDIDFLDRSGANRSRATSKEGVYYRERQFAELRGEVTLTNVNGERLETQVLFWDESKDSVYTREPVRVVTPTRVIYAANGLKANTSFTAWTMFDVSGKIQAKPEMTQ